MVTDVTKEEIIDEVQIVKQAQKNPRAFAPLYNKYYAEIFNYIFRRVNEEEATADITSQVFLKALIHLHKWKNEGLPFSAWLYRIALNECRAFYRKSQKVQFVVIDEISKSALQQELQLDIEAKYEQIEKGLQRLSSEEIQLIELRYYEKLNFREVGYSLDITENNAKVKLYRTIKKLKKIIQS